MSPEIFIEDFERTEHSDYLHGVIGRSLIIATKFDSMCVSLSMATDLRSEIQSATIGEDDFDALAKKVTSKYRTLNTSIKSLKQPEDISKTLHKSRIARNEIAHSLTKGFEWCIDIKINDAEFINEVSSLISTIAEGDLLISLLVSLFSNKPIPNLKYLSEYQSKIVNWVVDQ